MDQQAPPFLRFLALPAELRNTVYEYVLGNATYALEMDKGEERLRIKDRTAETPTQPPDVALLRVSRHIHTEASLLLYSKNTFSFRSYRHLRRFINGRTPEQAGAITVLQVETWLALYFYATNKNLRTVDWSILSGLHSLREVKFLPLIMLHQSMPNTHDFVGAAHSIRAVRPQTQFSARDPHGAWKIDSGVL
jgi:hypothetical protein